MSTVDLSDVRWRKSSFSGGEGGGNDNCVEVAFTSQATALRDSKNTNGPVLLIPTEAWTTFLAR